MVNKAIYRVLYFIVGSVPNEEQRRDITQYGPHATFRNKMFVAPDSGVENCTAVAGDAPELYTKRFPGAVSYADYLDGKLPPPPVDPESPDFDGEAEDLPEGTVSMSSFAGSPSADPFAPTANPGASVRRRGREPSWTKNG